jgi:hypothetical protein
MLGVPVPSSALGSGGAAPWGGHKCVFERPLSHYGEVELVPGGATCAPRAQEPALRKGVGRTCHAWVSVAGEGPPRWGTTGSVPSVAQCGGVELPCAGSGR